MTILVVDDAGFMRKIFADILRKVGFHAIVVAENGVDALAKLKENRIDLIISDWNMPEMDGLALLQAVRADEGTKAMPFIMATAQAERTNVAIAMAAGANGHIAKPFDEGQIREKIEQVFGVAAKASAPRAARTTADGKVRMRIAHIQITDHLVLGALQHQIRVGMVTPRYFELETICMSGWNPVQEALDKGRIDGAFILAPMAMDLFAFGADIRLILLAHKNGSSFVRSLSSPMEDFASEADFYKYRAVSIPHQMSIHHMLAHQYLRGLGLRPGVPGATKAINCRFEVAPPIQMPTIMKENEEVAGFIVAEPIGSNAINNKIAELQFVSSSLWPDHPCCVVAMRNECIQQYPDAVHEFTSLLIQAGKFVEQNKGLAADLGVGFLDPAKTLGLQPAIIQRVLEAENGITMNNLYPVLEDLDRIQRYMHEQMGVGKIVDLEKLVDLRFADAAKGD
jgi:CheY-like chemotaxis protein